MATATYPRIDPPHKLDDGSYVIRVHANANKVTEYPAKDIKTARQVFKLVGSVVDAVEVPTPPKRGRGRQLKLDDAMHDLIIECAGKRMAYKQIAQLAGIHEASLYRWLEVGERVALAAKDAADESEEERRCRELFEGLREAEATLQRHLLEQLIAASRTDTKAAIWLLTTRWRGEFVSDIGIQGSINVHQVGELQREARSRLQSKLAPHLIRK